MAIFPLGVVKKTGVKRADKSFLASSGIIVVALTLGTIHLSCHQRRGHLLNTYA